MGRRLPFALLALVTMACAPARVPESAHEESPLEHRLATETELSLHARARDAVCPSRNALRDASPLAQVDPPRGRWRVPASVEVGALEHLVAATPRDSPEHAPLLVRAVDVLARAELELLARCAGDLRTADADAVRQEIHAMHDAPETLAWIRERARAHCTVLAASDPELARRSRCRALEE